MYVWTSWGIVAIAALGAGYYYSTKEGQKKRGSGWKPFTPAQSRRRESSKQRRDSRDKRRKDTEGIGSDRAFEDTQDLPTTSAQAGGVEGAKKRKGKKQQPSKLVQNTVVDAPGQNEKIEANEEDLEFAKQLQDKMTGTSLKRQDDIQNKKARKQAKRAEAAVTAQNAGAAPQQQHSTASSTTGAEADDDMSSSTSLDLGPTPSGGDVSDMLEAPAKGPSILRITETSSAQPQKPQRQQKAPQEQETKKQRQNRQKREAEKELREETEKERRKVLENQRRTAREARGEPAKNGLGTSQLPVKNAWTGTSKAGGNADSTAMVPPPSGGSLLDTFEDQEPSASQSRENRAPAEKPAPNGAEYNGLPSEEEQMKLLSELDSDGGWNTVSKGGKRMKAKTSNGQLPTSKPIESAAPALATESVATFPKGAPGTALNAQASGAGVAKSENGSQTGGGGKKKATKETIDHDIWNRENIHEHPEYDPAFPYALTGHPLDDEWAVV